LDLVRHDHGFKQILDGHWCLAVSDVRTGDPVGDSEDGSSTSIVSMQCYLEIICTHRLSLG
jgi:hypothetical protein